MTFQFWEWALDRVLITHSENSQRNQRLRLREVEPLVNIVGLELHGKAFRVGRCRTCNETASFTWSKLKPEYALKRYAYEKRKYVQFWQYFYIHTNKPGQIKNENHSFSFNQRNKWRRCYIRLHKKRNLKSTSVVEIGAGLDSPSWLP